MDKKDKFVKSACLTIGKATTTLVDAINEWMKENGMLFTVNYNAYELLEDDDPLWIWQAGNTLADAAEKLCTADGFIEYHGLRSRIKKEDLRVDLFGGSYDSWIICHFIKRADVEEYVKDKLPKLIKSKAKWFTDGTAKRLADEKLMLKRINKIFKDAGKAEK